MQSNKYSGSEEVKHRNDEKRKSVEMEDFPFCSAHLLLLKQNSHHCGFYPESIHLLLIMSPHLAGVIHLLTIFVVNNLKKLCGRTSAIFIPHLSPNLSLAHLVAKPEEHQDEKILKERNEDEDHADQDPGDEGADSIRGWDAATGAVVQVDRHQKQGEEQAKPDKENLAQIEYSHHQSTFNTSPL